MNKDSFCHQDESEKLCQIRVFSQMNHIAVKTLCHYDEIGLLKPAYIDEGSGYRYYTSSQLLPLYKMLAFRDMGFSLGEIRQVYNGVLQKQLLKKRKQQLLKIMAETDEKLVCVESYLSGRHLDDEYRIILRSLPAVTIASVWVHLDSYVNLSYRVPDMGLGVEETGCECKEPGYHFIIYYDDEYREQDVGAEICEAVTGMREDHGDLEFREPPTVGLATCIMYKGACRTLPLAYRAIASFIEDNGYEMIGYQREAYINGIWNKDSGDDRLTEIQFPVRKIRQTQLIEQDMKKAWNLF